MSEHDEQVALFNLLSLYESKYPVLKWIHAIPNGGHRHMAVAKRMKAEGVRAGVWDIFVPVAVDDKSGLYIEMKFDDNKLTGNQQQFREGVGDAYSWEVCYTSVEAARAIGKYMDIDELKQVR